MAPPDLGSLPSDFCSLPAELLAQVFKKLPLSDRGRLASCSSVLPAIMDTPSVWTRVTFDLDVEDSTTLTGFPFSKALLDRKQRVVKGLLAKYLKVVQNYGRHFENVGVVLNFVFLEEKTVDLVKRLCEKRVLNHLSLLIDRPTKCLGFTTDKSHEAAAAGILDILKSDTEVTFKFLPFFCDILELRHLSGDRDRLFHNVTYSDKRLSLVKNLDLQMLPCEFNNQVVTTVTTRLVSSLPNLQELSVSEASLNDELLLELAKAPEKGKALRRLVINVTLDGLRALPPLSSAAWGQLTQACPSLTVDFHWSVKGLLLLDDIIRPETPLVRLEVRVHYFSDQDQTELHELCKRHSGSLEHFHLSVLTGYSVHRGLKEMVDACPKLQHLELDVTIEDSLLLELAGGPRRWRTFSFNPSRVMAGPGGEDIVMGAVPGKRDRLRVIDDLRLEEVEDSVREAVGFVTYL